MASLKQHRAHFCRQTVRFSEPNNCGALSFSRKRCWISGATKLFHRTNLATRIVRGANKGAEIHHGVLKIARPVLRNEFCREFPQFLPALGGINWGANIE